MSNYTDNDKLRNKVKAVAPELHNKLYLQANRQTKEQFYANSTKEVDDWYRQWRKEHQFGWRVFALVCSVFIIPVLVILIYKWVTSKPWVYPDFISPLKKEFAHQQALLAEKKEILPQEGVAQKKNLVQPAKKRQLAKVDVNALPVVDLRIDQKQNGRDNSIGAGGMGQVFTARDPRNEKSTIAVKVLKRADKNSRDNREKQQDLVEEGAMLAQVDSPYVVKSFGVVITQDKGVALLMEYVPNGNLDGLLRSRESLDWRAQFNLSREVALGLRAIHQMGIVWSDVKTQNIFVWAEVQERFWNNKVTWHVKLGDFGMAHFEDKSVSGGTIVWMAPEVLLERKKTTRMSDVYGLGLVFHQITARERPFSSYLSMLGGLTKRSEERFLTDMRASDGTMRPSLEVVDSEHPRFANMIRLAWAKNPEDRPRIEEVVDDFESMPQPK